MTQLVCKVCQMIVCEDIDRIKDVKEIQCPNCGRIFLNPFWEGKDE